MNKEMEGLIVQFAKVAPNKSYKSVAKWFSNLGILVTPGAVRGVFKRYGIQTSYERYKSIQEESRLTGTPVDPSIQNKLLRQRRRHTDSGLSQPKRPFEVVVWGLSNLRLQDNNMIYLNIFFDLYTNTAEIRPSSRKNDVRLMESLDSYLLYIRTTEQMLPEVLITTASPTVAGASEENIFRARLEKDGIEQLTANSRSTAVSKIIQDYSRELKMLLQEFLREITIASKFDPLNLRDVEEIVSELSDTLNLSWKKRPRLVGPIFGLPVDET